MRKPLIFTDVNVDPVRNGEDSGPCEICEKEAHWIAGRPHVARFFCAYCFLYETDGSAKYADQIEELVKATEESMGRSISSNGKAAREHADRILGAIMMTTRMVRSRGKMKKIAVEDEKY